MKRFFSFAILAFVIGCSNYIRTADAGVSAQDVFNKLQMLESQSGTASIMGGMSGDSVLYYSEGPGPLGPPVSVAALSDLTAFNGFGSAYDLTAVQVFMIYTPSQGSVQLLLGIQTAGSGSFTVSSFSGGFSSDKGGFTATLQGQNGETLTLESNDVDSDGNLVDVIQVNVTSSAGYIGKFSTLVGFAAQ